MAAPLDNALPGESPLNLLDDGVLLAVMTHLNPLPDQFVLARTCLVRRPNNPATQGFVRTLHSALDARMGRSWMPCRVDSRMVRMIPSSQPCCIMGKSAQAACFTMPVHTTQLVQPGLSIHA
jgi:hypothetical protein